MEKMYYGEDLRQCIFPEMTDLPKLVCSMEMTYSGSHETSKKRQIFLILVQI